MNAIMTVVMGEAENWFKYTGPYMAEYAARWHMAFYVIRQSNYENIHPWWAKLEIGRLLETYNRVIYVDADAYIMPDCPNLFDVVPEDRVGIYDHGISQPNDVVTKEMNACVSVFGTTYPDILDFYYNAGVAVYSRIHKSLFGGTLEEVVEIDRRLKENGCWWPEQSLLNYRIRQFDFHVFLLDYRFNHRPDDCPTWGKDRFDSYIIHNKYSIVIDALHLAKLGAQRRNKLTMASSDEGA